MIQLQRHIEILLLSHDCVIVPGFGGFITHHVEARYDEDDTRWLPPFRTLGFNPQLTLNDSLLAQSYVEAYDISYPDALRQIESEVEELKAVLRNQGAYEMDGVGTLQVNVDGHYEFTPCEAGILSPEEYGLADFEFARLKSARSQTTPKVTDIKADNTVEAEEKQAPNEAQGPALLDFIDDDDDENKALTIKMSWVRNAVAIAAAIACFFLLATPVANSDLGNQAMSQLQGNIIYKLMPKDSNMTPAQPVMKAVSDSQLVAVKAVNETKAEQMDKELAKEAATEGKTATEEKAATASKATAKQTYYCIVLASQVKRSNAEEYVEKLKKIGIEDARINIDNGTLRVICGQYDEQAQAYSQLNKMIQEDEFAEAWVLKIKD